MASLALILTPVMKWLDELTAIAWGWLGERKNCPMAIRFIVFTEGVYFIEVLN